MRVEHPQIDVTVDELVIEGVRPADRDRVAGAFTRELEALLAERWPSQSATVEVLDQGPLRVPAGARPERLGREAARALHRRLGG